MLFLGKEFQKTPIESRSKEVPIKLAIDNADLTIKDWIASRPYPMAEEDRFTLNLILAFDRACKEMIRFGRAE